MDLFTRADLRTLLEECGGPCVSLYMSARPGGSQQDPVRFRNLIGRAEERLGAHGLRAPEARDFLAPLQSLAADAMFWPNQCDGLAVFAARDFLRVYRLPCPFDEELEVGGLFQIAPLLPLLAGDGRFFVLALSQNAVRLFKGTRFTVSPVDLKGAPRNITEALRTHDRDEVLTFHTRRTSGGTWGAIFEGHGVGIDDKKNDLLQYFQQIDCCLHELLREERAPLVLAAVDYLLPIYREVSAYPHLLEEGIVGNPDRLSEKDLHDRAWVLVGSHFRESIRRAVGVYQQAAGVGKATADSKRVIPAAYRGEVETLFVAQGQHLWGTLDPLAGDIELHEKHEIGDEDLINVAAIHTLRHGNSVFALPLDGMPGGGALAAIYHLPLPKHGRRS
ncbi:MAG: hypothetical protein ACKODX_14940 [Gemmata sp.]